VEVLTMEKEIARFEKNLKEEVIIRITEFNGVELFDIRAYVKQVIPSDKPIATKKGLCLRLEQFPEFFEAVKKTGNEIKKLQDKSKQE